jgi:hypothetical protein
MNGHWNINRKAAIHGPRHGAQPIATQMIGTFTTRLSITARYLKFTFTAPTSLQVREAVVYGTVNDSGGGGGGGGGVISGGGIMSYSSGGAGVIVITSSDDAVTIKIETVWGTDLIPETTTSAATGGEFIIPAAYYAIVGTPTITTTNVSGGNTQLKITTVD